MKILITGATGYLGKLLAIQLVKQGHQIVCCARSLNRVHENKEVGVLVQWIQFDFLRTETLSKIHPILMRLTT